MAVNSYFHVVPTRTHPPIGMNRAYLVTDFWDDWGKHSTMYELLVDDQHGKRHEIGAVKIGQFDMADSQRRPALPSEFAELGEQFFSIGQDDAYYANLNALGPQTRSRILRALRDLALDEPLFRRALLEEVTTRSLLRFVSPVTVRGRFRRLARGDSTLSRYSFTYYAPRGSRNPPDGLSLSFVVEPEAEPPTNLQVIIGRNGVGKTTLLRGLTQAFLNPAHSSGARLRFDPEEGRAAGDTFANLVSVTFSAFDPFTVIDQDPARPQSLRYLYIGLQRGPGRDGEPLPPKGLDDLRQEFVNSAGMIRKQKRTARWRQALEVLESDPLFSEAGIADLGETEKGRPTDGAGRRFDRLSSGHKIVLLIITKLVEVLEERTLLLLDEPEAHLHPPLLSAFMRALSDLMQSRNGVAIIATHSPVVLQEVPRSCVWVLRRSGALSQAQRPELETFGENVGVLTRAAFGFEVTETGFHKLLADQVEEGQGFALLRAKLGNQLGVEALAILRGLTSARDNPDAGRG